MKRADIFVNDIKAGQLIEHSPYAYEFKYEDSDLLPMIVPNTKRHIYKQLFFG